MLPVVHKQLEMFYTIHADGGAQSTDLYAQFGLKLQNKLFLLFYFNTAGSDPAR